MNSTKSLRVLSIDFDYFQDVSEKLLYTYPDGIDLNSEISQIIWGSHYAQNDELFDIGVDKSELRELEKLLDAQNTSCPVLIAQTHKDIYDFIENHMSDDTIVEIVNIDMHHDIYNSHREIDCGNWLGHMIKKHGAKAQWVIHPLSCQYFPTKYDNNVECLGSIRDISDDAFDIIFLCRSDMWLPPHLDIAFTDIVSKLTESFIDVTIHDNVDKPRTEYKAAYLLIKSKIKESH